MTNFTYNKQVDDWSLGVEKQYSSMWGAKNKPQPVAQIDLATDLLIGYLNNYWNKNESEIFKKLNIITGLDLKPDNYKFYVNSSGLSLHNTGDRYISIGLNHSFASYPTIIIHELLHIFFYEYLKKHQEIDAKFSESEKNDVKEIITIIINENFNDLIFLPDQGYPNHQKIREKTLVEWKKNKEDFGSFILKTLEILREAS